MALSSTSGAAKKRAAKAAAVAKASPPSLAELTETALSNFGGREYLYRSTLRAAVRQIDPVNPSRSFADKEEWKRVLTALESKGKIRYDAATDTIYPCVSPPAPE